jgi:hypothetical protein
MRREIYKVEELAIFSPYPRKSNQRVQASSCSLEHQRNKYVFGVMPLARPPQKALEQK